MPIVLGPRSRMPASRASRTSSCSNWRPFSPVSLKPEVISSMCRMPLAFRSGINALTFAAGLFLLAAAAAYENACRGEQLAGSVSGLIL